MNENQKIVERITPEYVNSPVGKYSHITKITNPVHFYTFSGQVGVDEHGKFSKDFNIQVKQTFINMGQVLKSQSISHDHVIKVNIWATEEIDWDYFYAEWDDFFGMTPPSMTIAYIKALGLPEIKLEIELWAVS